MKKQSESTIRSKSKSEDENLVNLFVTLTKYMFMNVLQTISILLSYTIIKYYCQTIDMLVSCLENLKLTHFLDGMEDGSKTNLIHQSSDERKYLYKTFRKFKQNQGKKKNIDTKQMLKQ